MDKMVKVAKYILIGFVGLIVLGLFMPSSPDTASKAQASEVVAKEEETVRDGKFQLDKYNIECGISKANSEWGTTYKPLGQFCKVTFTVTNIGNEPQYFESSNQLLIDSVGREYKYESSVSDDRVWMENLNPGLSLSGYLYFDIPVDADLAYFELHDGWFSDGIRIPLK